MFILTILYILIGLGLYKALSIIPILEEEDMKNLKWYCILWPIFSVIIIWRKFF